MLKITNAHTDGRAVAHLACAGIALLAAGCLYDLTLSLCAGQPARDLLPATLWLLPLAMVALSAALLRQGRRPFARGTARLAALGYLATSGAALLSAASAFWSYQGSEICGRPSIRSMASAAPACRTLAHAGWLLAGLSLAAVLALLATLQIRRSLQCLRAQARSTART